MNRSPKEFILTSLKEVVSCLQALDDSQLEDLLAGKTRLECRIIRVTKEPACNRKDMLPEGFEKKAVETLHKFSTRDEGERYLKDSYTLKEDLLKIARYLDLPVQKKETIQQIKDKIIESTIGFRIRSAAVQGTSREP